MKRKFFPVCLKTALAAVIICYFTAPAAMARPGKGSQVMDVIRKYDGCDGVESVTLGPFLMGIARMAVSREECADFLKYIDRMAIFVAAGADDRLKSEIAADLGKGLEAYETAVEMKDDGDDMTIYFSIPEHDAVSEMVLVSDSEMSVILLSGDMPLSELAFIAAGASGY